MFPSPVFIVGCPRSGTHLLRNLLRSHPNLGFGGETHFVPGFYSMFGDPGSDREAGKLAELILNLQWIRARGLTLAPGSLAHLRSFAQITDSILGACAQVENKPRWMDKTPQYVAHMPLLLKLFPDARFIHIIRDGRDVALSWLGMGFGPENLYTAASQWRDFVSAGLQSAAGMPAGTCIEVRYEQLLRETGAVLREVCDFIGEPYCEEMLTPNPLKLDYFPVRKIFGRPASHRVRALDPWIDADNLFKWKSRMSSSGLVLFESVAGELLQRLGYETDGRRRHISAVERYFWKAHQAVKGSFKRLNNRNRFKWIWTDLVLLWAEIRNRRKPAQT